MEFKKGQIWRTKNPDAEIRIIDVSVFGLISFEVTDNGDGWKQCTEWQSSVLELFIKDHDFVLEVA